MRDPDIRRRIGLALKNARALAGMTQQELADRAGLHWTAVSRYERGAVEPTLANIERLEKALGRSLDLPEFTPPHIPDDIDPQIQRGIIEAARRLKHYAQAMEDEAVKRLTHPKGHKHK